MELPLNTGNLTSYQNTERNHLKLKNSELEILPAKFLSKISSSVVEDLTYIFSKARKRHRANIYDRRSEI